MTDSSKKQEPLVVGVDAMVIIWGVRDQNLQSNDSQTTRVRYLFDDLTSKVARIVLAVPALAEILQPIPAEKHSDFVQELKKFFVLQHLDIPGSCHAAVAQKAGLAARQPGVVGERDRVKVDALIVGACKAAGVTEFYSHDKNCRLMASTLGMQAKDLPTRSNTLFNLNEDADRPARPARRKKTPKAD